MRAGWNPTKRNRNIGTTKQGHGQDNQLVIPKDWPDDRIFWEVLKRPIAVPQQIGECDIIFLVEPPRPDCFYPCTIEDVSRVLGLVPDDHLDGIELIIYRQPTRKQAKLSSVWGRFLYYAVPGKYSGTAICIEAHDLAERWNWPSSLDPERQLELDRLRADGHQVTSEKRGYRIERTAESVRNTVLFRTVLHELGHYVDWLQSVIRPSLRTNDPAEDERLSREFNGKPSRMKEDFAHRYASECAERLRNAGTIPFAPLFDPPKMIEQQLAPEWFTPP